MLSFHSLADEFGVNKLDQQQFDESADKLRLSFASSSNAGGGGLNVSGSKQLMVEQCVGIDTSRSLLLHEPQQARNDG